LSTSLRSRIRQGFLLGCVSGAALFAIAVGQASAATTTSVAVDSTFNGELEGWTKPANEQSSLLGILPCIEGVTCPSVTDEFHATGGVGNSGYIETNEGGVLSVGLLAESTGIWESPEFTYLGVAGQRPTKVGLTLARRAQLSNLLTLSGAQATYTVELVDKTAPSGTVVVVNGATLPAAEEWKSTSTAISPDILTKGDNYKIRIRTTFVTPAAVVPKGGVGYDNVELTASRDEVEEGPKGSEGREGPAGAGGSKGGEGSDGSGAANGKTGKTSAGDQTGSKGTKGDKGSATLSAARLREVIGAQGLAATASLHKGHVVVTGMCPKSTKGACTVRIRGMLTRKKVATSSGRARIAEGGRHRFSVALNPKARGAVQKSGRLLVKEWVRVGKARVTVYKPVKLVQR
jgi:hypothetical protein